MAVTQIRGNVQIKSGTITNTEIAASANIATSKLADGAEFLKRDGSVPLTSSLDANTHQINNLGTPINPNDAATKAYVDAITIGLDFKESVRASTLANITLSGLQTIDGVSLIAGDRVLVKNQTTGANNGIYVVASGSWTRALDADTSSEVTAGMFTFVEEGTTNHDTSWVLSTDNPITLGSTNLVFTQFAGAGSVTAVNVGTGVGTYDSTSGSQLNFRSVNNSSGKITVSLSSQTIFLDIGAGTLVNADIATGAAIARNKLASGSANHVIINDGSGVLSSEAQLAISRGGTNSGTALVNNRVMQSSGGAIVEAAAITANRALISDGNGIPTHSTTTATELGYVSGVTSAIQTQLNGKLSTTNFIVRETPSGAVDGSNTSFTLANTPSAGKEQVFLNGILQEPGAGNDYTISGATITYLAAPQTGDRLRVNYIF